MGLPLSWLLLGDGLTQLKVVGKNEGPRKMLRAEVAPLQLWY